METQKLVRWLLAVIGVLVFLNIGLVGWMLWGQARGRPPMNGPMALKFLEQELAFTEEQRQQVIASREKLSEKARPLEDSVRNLRQQLFLLTKTSDKAVEEQLVQQIGRFVSRLEQARFEHFKEIRSLCTAQQQERLDEILQELAMRQGPPPGGPGRRGMGPEEGGPPPGGPEGHP